MSGLWVRRRLKPCVAIYLTPCTYRVSGMRCHTITPVISYIDLQCSRFLFGPPCPEMRSAKVEPVISASVPAGFPTSLRKTFPSHHKLYPIYMCVFPKVSINLLHYWGSMYPYSINARILLITPVSFEPKNDRRDPKLGSTDFRFQNECLGGSAAMYIVFE